MPMNSVRALVSADLEAVNQLILEKIQSEISLIDNLANHIIQSGGKRLRPLLVLLASKACGYDGDNHIRLATMIEFFHTATLLHDDVVDESTLRRGRETANEIWGSKASILVGDYLLTQYMQLMLDVGDLKIMRLLTEISHQIGCGEIKQLVNKNNINLSEEDYFDVIRSKTSLLFAASASLGALVSQQAPDIEAALFQYGTHLGNAFQLIDDALDYCSNSEVLGKNIGDDLADGKATLPLLHILKVGNENQKSLIKNSLQDGNLGHLPEVLQAIKDTKAVEYTKHMAAVEVDKAISCLQSIPKSAYKDALCELANFALERDH